MSVICDCLLHSLPYSVEANEKRSHSLAGYQMHVPNDGMWRWMGWMGERNLFIQQCKPKLWDIVEHRLVIISFSPSLLILFAISSSRYLRPLSVAHFSSSSSRHPGIAIAMNIIAIIITVINILHRIFRRFCINFISNRKSRSITAILDLPSFCCYTIIIIIIFGSFSLS